MRLPSPYLRGYDNWLVKLNKSGAIVSDKYLRRSNEESFTGTSMITQTPNGNFIVQNWADYSRGVTSYLNENLQLVTDASSNIGTAVVHTNDSTFYTLTNSGDIILSKYVNLARTPYYFGGTRNDWYRTQNSLIQSGNDLVIVGATESNNSGDVGPNNASSYKPDIWIVKCSMNGEIKWEKSFGEVNDWNDGYSIITSQDGNLIILGLSSYPLKTRILKIDQSGSLIWDKYITDCRPNDLYYDIDGGVLVLTHSSSNNGDFIGNEGENDSYLFKFDANGNKQWVKRFGGEYDDELEKILVDANGDIYLFGSTSSLKFNAMGHHGPFNGNTSNGDLWVIKLERSECNITGDLRINENLEDFKYYKTSQKVEIDNSILENESLFISSDLSIKLLPGFESFLNSTINLNISGCN